MPVLIIELRFIALCCLEGLDYLYYHSDSKWEAYSNYNSIRGKINDNPNLSKFVNEDLRTSVKEITTPQDFLLMAFNFFPDPTVLTYEKLVKIEDTLNNQQVSSKLNNITFIKEHKTLNILLVFYAIIFIYFNKQKRLNIFLLVVVFFGVLSILSFDNIVKDRVYYPAFLMALLALIFINSNKNLEKVGVFLFLPLLLLSILTLQISNELLRKNEGLRGNFDKQQLLINKYLLNKQKKLIPFSNTYKAYYNNIFEISNKFPEQRILYCGWMSAIPFNENKFESFKDLVDGNFGLLLNDNVATAVKFITQSIYLNHNIRVMPRIAIKDERYFIVEFKEVTTKP